MSGEHLEFFRVTIARRVRPITGQTTTCRKTRQNIRNCTGCIELYRIPFEVQGAAGSGKVLQGSGLGR